MNAFWTNFSNFSTRAIYVIYSIFMLVLLHHFVTDVQKEHYIVLFIGFVLICSIGAFVIHRSSVYAEKYSETIIVCTLLAVCLAIKLAWIWMYQIPPYVDYAAFYSNAVELSKHEVVSSQYGTTTSRYIALFPHIFGYAWFLSFFITLFGEHQMLAPIVNVILSTISMGLLYVIGKKIGGMRIGITVSILWIILPSQTIYNMFVLSEPLYTTVLLLIWVIMISIHEKFQRIGMVSLIVYSVIVATLLVFMNMSRPIAVIPMIALAIWLFIIKVEDIRDKKVFMKKSVYVVTMIGTYFLLSIAAREYITARLGQEIAEVPGYTIYVGLNTGSSGAWNQEDSNLFNQYRAIESWSANDVQQKMFEEAKERAFSGDIHFLELVYKKFLVFMADDSLAAKYAQEVLEHDTRYHLLSNIFYYFLVAFSFIGACIACKQKHKGILIIICLYAIGLILAQLLVEVAGRYHYSATLSMIILAAFGMHHLFGKKKENIS